MPPLYSDLVAAKAKTAAAVAADQAKLSTDQATVTADQSQLSTNQMADASSDASIAAALGPPSVGVFVDVANPNSDGTVNVYIMDTSPKGYHVVAAPTSASPVPPPSA